MCLCYVPKSICCFPWGSQFFLTPLSYSVIILPSCLKPPSSAEQENAGHLHYLNPNFILTCDSLNSGVHCWLGCPHFWGRRLPRDNIVEVSCCSGLRLHPSLFSLFFSSSWRMWPFTGEMLDCRHHFVKVPHLPGPSLDQIPPLTPFTLPFTRLFPSL